MSGKHKCTPEEQSDEIERVARVNGANLVEKGFNDALEKLVKGPAK